MLALASYQKASSSVLRRTFFVLRQIFSHHHTKAAKIILPTLIFKTLFSKVPSLRHLQQTCFTILLHQLALGLQDASLQAVSQAEGAFKNATPLQREWIKMVTY